MDIFLVIILVSIEFIYLTWWSLSSSNISNCLNFLPFQQWTCQKGFRIQHLLQQSLGVRLNVKERMNYFTTEQLLVHNQIYSWTYPMQLWKRWIRNFEYQIQTLWPVSNRYGMLPVLSTGNRLVENTAKHLTLHSKSPQCLSLCNHLHELPTENWYISQSVLYRSWSASSPEPLTSVY